MRLTPQQIQSIIEALTPFLAGSSAELRLYGSRVHDALKGGDIDLLLRIDSPTVEQQLRLQKHELLAAIKKNIGDQKIDLTIASPHQLTTDLFLSLIMPQSIILNTW